MRQPEGNTRDWRGLASPPEPPSASSCCSSSPGAPAGDADALDHVDAELTDVHKEEEEEPEGAVAPAHREEEEEEEVGRVNNRGGAALPGVSEPHLNAP